MVQRLEKGDEARRLDLCWWVIANRRLIPFILYADEGCFSRNDKNNTHGRWSDKNPHAIEERNSPHRFSVNVWCGVIDSQLIGPAVLPNRLNTLRTGLLNCLNARSRSLTFRHRGSCV